MEPIINENEQLTGKDALSDAQRAAVDMICEQVLGKKGDGQENKEWEQKVRVGLVKIFTEFQDIDTLNGRLQGISLLEPNQDFDEDMNAGEGLAINKEDQLCEVILSARRGAISCLAGSGRLSLENCNSDQEDYNKARATQKSLNEVESFMEALKV